MKLDKNNVAKKEKKGLGSINEYYILAINAIITVFVIFFLVSIYESYFKNESLQEITRDDYHQVLNFTNKSQTLDLKIDSYMKDGMITTEEYKDLKATSSELNKSLELTVIKTNIKQKLKETKDAE